MSTGATIVLKDATDMSNGATIVLKYATNTSKGAEILSSSVLSDHRRSKLKNLW